MTRARRTSGAGRLILDLVRHGDALPAGETGDDARRLSARGRADVARLADRLLVEAPVLTHVFVSPLARAKETAAILLAGRVNAPTLEVTRALVPEADPEEFLAELAVREIEAGSVVAVAHEPLLGRLAEYLTDEITLFLTATCVRITSDGEPGRRRWHLTHRIHLPAP